MNRGHIEFRDIWKQFSVGRGVVEALQGISLEIRRGEIFGIIGRSGAGKSTLVRVINQLEPPTRGSVVIDGEDITRCGPAELRKWRQRIGMIFQHFNLLGSRTVAENVALPLHIAGGRSRASITTRVTELLTRVGLADQAAKYPAQLSGGQKQRVGIARALACGPSVLLCDEATSALDPETTRSILQLLAELNREFGLTIVVITHQMEVVRRVCDRVAVLDAGRVVELGTVADVFLHPKHTVTRRFVLEAEQVDEAEQLDDFAHVPGRIVRMTFRGDATYTPLLARIARETGIDYTLLDGRINRIKDTPYSQLTLAFAGGNVAGALDRLSAAGAHLEDLRT